MYVFFFSCLTNKNHKNLSWVIAEATALDLQFVLLRLHVMQPQNCLQYVPLHYLAQNAHMIFLHWSLGQRRVTESISCDIRN
jgi:hypothetical protein